MCMRPMDSQFLYETLANPLGQGNCDAMFEILGRGIGFW